MSKNNLHIANFAIPFALPLVLFHAPYRNWKVLIEFPAKGKGNISFVGYRKNLCKKSPAVVVANLADSTKDKRRQDEARQGETRPAETQPSSLGTVDRPCYWHSNDCPIEWQSINNNGNPMPDAGACRQQFWARFPPPKTHRTRQSSKCLVLSLMQTLPLVPPAHPPLGKTTNQSKEEKETQKKVLKCKPRSFCDLLR